MLECRIQENAISEPAWSAFDSLGLELAALDMSCFCKVANTAR